MSRKTYRLPTRMPLKCPARECPKTAYEFPPNAHVNALPMPSSKCPKMNSNVQDRLQNAHANALEMPCSGPSASASTTSPKRNLNAYEYPPKVRGTAKYIVDLFKFRGWCPDLLLHASRSIQQFKVMLRTMRRLHSQRKAGGPKKKT